MEPVIGTWYMPMTYIYICMPMTWYIPMMTSEATVRCSFSWSALCSATFF